MMKLSLSHNTAQFCTFWLVLMVNRPSLQLRTAHLGRLSKCGTVLAVLVILVMIFTTKTKTKT